MESIERSWFDFGITKDKVEDMGYSPREVLELYEEVITDSGKTIQSLAYMQFETTLNGIDMYYCFGTGTYHFAQEEN